MTNIFSVVNVINGNIEGTGVYTQKNGSIYRGKFIKGIPNGKGTFYKFNGDRFTGIFINGKLEGEGTLDKENGGLRSSQKFHLPSMIDFFLKSGYHFKEKNI